MLAAVASALLFERVGNLAWLAGGLGALAAVIAVAVYFYNQSLAKPDNAVKDGAFEQTAKEAHPVSTGLDTLQAFSLTRPVHRGRASVFSSWFPVPVIWTRHAELELVRAARSSYWRACRHNALWQTEFVEVVDKLSSPREYPSFEFVLTRDGNFAIHQVGRPRATALELEKAQGDSWLPFPPLPQT